MQTPKSDYSHLRDCQEKIQNKIQKDKIVKHASIAIKTSFIYCLDQFEKRFGKLWGEDLPDGAELTQDQEYWDDQYEVVRKNILDNGNEQIRRFKDFMGHKD